MIMDQTPSSTGSSSFLSPLTLTESHPSTVPANSATITTPSTNRPFYPLHSFGSHEDPRQVQLCYDAGQAYPPSQQEFHTLLASHGLPHSAAAMSEHSTPFTGPADVLTTPTQEILASRYLVSPIDTVYSAHTSGDDPAWPTSSAAQTTPTHPPQRGSSTPQKEALDQSVCRFPQKSKSGHTIIPFEPEGRITRQRAAAAAAASQTDYTNTPDLDPIFKLPARPKSVQPRLALEPLRDTPPPQPFTSIEAPGPRSRIPFNPLFLQYSTAGEDYRPKASAADAKLHARDIWSKGGQLARIGYSAPVSATVTPGDHAHMACVQALLEFSIAVRSLSGAAYDEWTAFTADQFQPGSRFILSMPTSSSISLYDIDTAYLPQLFTTIDPLSTRLDITAFHVDTSRSNIPSLRSCTLQFDADWIWVHQDHTIVWNCRIQSDWTVKPGELPRMTCLEVIVDSFSGTGNSERDQGMPRCAILVLQLAEKMEALTGFMTLVEANHVTPHDIAKRMSNSSPR